MLDALRAARGMDTDAAPSRRGKAKAAPADTHDVPAIKLGKLKASDYDKPREPLPSLSFAFDAPVTHGAVLSQLGEPSGWDDGSSPADVLAPLVRAAAEVARRMAMGEPSETDVLPAEIPPTEGSSKSRAPTRAKSVGKRIRE